MKTPPNPSDREVLAGLVERVTYQNAENGFCVIRVKARSHRELVTVVGHAATISAGEWITASGDWVNDRTHGQQFRARFLKTERRRPAATAPPSRPQRVALSTALMPARPSCARGNG
jgi:hypothetical protein